MDKFYFTAREASLIENDRVEGACARAVFYNYYKMTGNTIEIPIFEIGKTIEYHRYKQHAAAGDLVIVNGKDSQQFVHGWFPELSIPVLGFTDMFIQGSNILDRGINLPDVTLVEVKSISDFMYDSIKTSPYTSSLLQVSVYLYLLRDFVKEAVIQFITRNSGLEFWWKVFWENNTLCCKQIYSTTHGYIEKATASFSTEVTLDKILQRFLYIETYIKSNTLPDRDFQLTWTKNQINKMIVNRDKRLNNEDKKKFKSQGYLMKGDYQCASCPYKKLCWELKDDD